MKCRWLAQIVLVVPVVLLSLVTQAYAFPVLGEIHGTKWNDLNGNGSRDAGEPGLAGWVIALDRDDDGSDEETVVTDVTGAYWFTDLVAGLYGVSEQPIAGWSQTFPSGNGHHTVFLDPGAITQGIDFGNIEDGRPPRAIPEPSGAMLFGVGVLIVRRAIRRK